MCFGNEPGWKNETVGDEMVISQWVSPGRWQECARVQVPVVVWKQETVGDHVVISQWINYDSLLGHIWQLRARIPAPIAVSLCLQILGDYHKRPRADPNYMYGQIDGFTAGGA